MARVYRKHRYLSQCLGVFLCTLLTLLPSVLFAGRFFNRGNGGGGCPSCANGQCPTGQCPNCPAAPAIVQPPCDACGDKICRPPENLPPPKPIPSPPVKVTTVVTVAPLPAPCQEAATITARRPLLSRLHAWNERRFHLFPRRR